MIPSFHGISNTNVPMERLWDQSMFPKAFTVALVNHMRDIDRPLNLISMTKTGGTEIGELPVDDLYGSHDVPFREMSFDFDCPDPRFAGLADGAPCADLVVTSWSKKISKGFRIMSSVIPDASTKGLDDSLMGPEMTVRSDTLCACALSIASSLREHRDEALHILDIGSADDEDAFRLASDSLDRLERRFAHEQRPFLIQFVWKSERDGPLLAKDAMDVFVWTDHAFTRLFLDITKQSFRGRVSRPERAALRAHRVISEVLRGSIPNIDNIIDETEQGKKGSKEFMVNGRATNRIMACPRLTRPSASSNIIPLLVSSGFQERLEPERRLDTSIYYSVRNLQG